MTIFDLLEMIEVLEARVARLERLLVQLHPQTIDMEV